MIRSRRLLPPIPALHGMVRRDIPSMLPADPAGRWGSGATRCYPKAFQVVIRFSPSLRIRIWLLMDSS